MVDDILKKVFGEIGIELNDKQINQFQKYYEILIDVNKYMNLTAITEEKDVIIKHFLDSISIVVFKELDFINKVKKMDITSVIDIGTGAGFPGIPLKIIFPSLNITLVDSLNKRVNFLNTVIDELKLDKITAIHARAEEIAKDDKYREKYDLCVSRAVANLATLSEYCLPFVRVNKYFVPYKSQKLDEEILYGKKCISVMGGKIIDKYKFILPETDNERSFIFIKKIKNTPKKYPRSGNKPSKEPIC